MVLCLLGGFLPVWKIPAESECRYVETQISKELYLDQAFVWFTQSQTSCSPTFLCSQFWSSWVWLSVMKEVRTSVLLICGARDFFLTLLFPLHPRFLRTQHGCQASAQNLTRCSEPVKSLGVHHLCAWPAKCHVIIITISQSCINLCVNLHICAWQ